MNINQLGRTSNVGSKATSSALGKASSTALGSNRVAAVKTSASTIDRSANPATRKTIHPGSKAGLNDQKAVHLQGNNSGYSARSNQTARYTANKSLPSARMNKDTMLAPSSPKLNDSRLTSSKDSSISQLARRR